MMVKKGIDVSKWQGVIDWKKVKAAGIEFAMIRLGYGSEYGYECKTDSLFIANMEGAMAAGVDIGVYFYSYALSATAAAKEATFVIEKLAPYKGRLRYPVAYDLEDERQKNLGKTILSAMVTGFCTTIEKAGYYASFYSNTDWCRNRLDMEALKVFDLWLAQWTDQAPTGPNHGIWQYTSSGSVPGINGNVDMNIAYRDYPVIIGGTRPSKNTTYTVKTGGTLSKIAADHGTTLAALIAENPQIKNPNLIHAGDVINVPGGNEKNIKTYVVKRGDTISKIAKAYNVTLAALIAENPQIKNPNLIHVGDVVNIPV